MSLEPCARGDVKPMYPKCRTTEEFWSKTKILLLFSLRTVSVCVCVLLTGLRSFGCGLGCGHGGHGSCGLDSCTHVDTRKKGWHTTQSRSKKHRSQLHFFLFSTKATFGLSGLPVSAQRRGCPSKSCPRFSVTRNNNETETQASCDQNKTTRSGKQKGKKIHCCLWNIRLNTNAVPKHEPVPM